MKPFLKLVNAHAIDPTKPLGTRAPRQRRQGRRDARHLPGRPPHRHRRPDEGLRRHGDDRRQGRRRRSCRCASTAPSARASATCSSTQTKKALVPEDHRHHPAAAQARASIPHCKGKARRQAAGAALQDIMVDTAVETAPHRPDAVCGARRRASGRATPASRRRGPLGTSSRYGKLILGAQVLGAKLAPLAPVGAAVGVMLPNSAGVAVTFFALQIDRPRAGDAQLHRRRRRTSPPPARRPRCRRDPDLARLRREGPPRRPRSASSRRLHASSISRTSAPTITARRQARAACCAGAPPAGRARRRTIRPRSCSRRARRARRRASCSRTATCSPTPRSA